MKRIIATIVISLAAISATAQKVPFEGGEMLVYNVAYRAKLIPPINLMRVTLRTMQESGQYHVIANGSTGGAVRGIFNLNDTYHTWLDRGTLLPSRMISDLIENDYRLKATYNYDWNEMVVGTTVRRPSWTADRYTRMPLTADSGDALSLFYRLRAIDIESLVVGKAYPLDLVLNEVTRPIEYTYHGRETIKIKKLGTRKVLKFTCTMATSDGTSYEEGMTLTAWISDDERRAPLLLECPIRIGRVTVTLEQ